MMEACCLCTTLGWMFAIVIICMFLFLYMTSVEPNLTQHETEKYYLDPQRANKKFLFPRLTDSPTIDLTVVIPAYCEEERLPAMLDEALGYLEEKTKQKPSFSYELIIVDDGSTDKTTQTGLGYSERYGVDKVRVMTLFKNRGKGGAVRMGMLSGRGKYLLFADADGATKFSDIAKLENEMKKMDIRKDEMAIVCGSRAHLEQNSIAQRSFFRTVLMLGFHFLVWFLCVRGVKDTQCGFKLLTRQAARLVFYNLHVERWAFDVDMLHIAEKFNLPISEVAVTWTEIEGSKLSPFWVSLQMGRDLILIRLRYLTGMWKMEAKPKSQ